MFSGYILIDCVAIVNINNAASPQGYGSRKIKESLSNHGGIQTILGAFVNRKYIPLLRYLKERYRGLDCGLMVTIQITYDTRCKCSEGLVIES